MPLASFQNKIFNVSSQKKYTMTDLSWSGSLETEAQEKLKSKPSTYIKGESLNTMSFDIPLRADFGIDPRFQIEDWEGIMSRATPALFILGNKPIGKNKWLLKSVGTSEMEIDGRGAILKAMLKLEFEEFVRAGKATAAPSGTGTNNQPAGTTSANIEPNQYIYDPPDKASEKRKNPNLTAALQAQQRLRGEV